MAQKTEESARSASASLNQTISHAQSVLGAVPGPGTLAVVERSAALAMNSLRSVSLQSASASDFLGNPSGWSGGPDKAGRAGQGPGEGIRTSPPGGRRREEASPPRVYAEGLLVSLREEAHLDAMQPEERYSAMARGRENPPVTYTQEEASAGAAEAESRLSRGRAPRVIPDDVLFSRAHAGFALLDAAFLGDTLYARFVQNPPVISAGASSFGEAGTYFSGTNCIGFNTGTSKWGSEDSSIALAAHEALHYAAYLGGGDHIRWRDDAGAPVTDSVRWEVDEGGTEYFAQLLARRSGHSPTSVAYPNETLVWFYMGAVLGNDSPLLRMAFLSGDFSDVRSAIDSRLGAGTFDSIMMRSPASAALELVKERMAAAGIDYHQWDSDPLASTAMASAAVQRPRAAS